MERMATPDNPRGGAGKRNFPETKHINLSIGRAEGMRPIMKALGSPLRLEILRILGAQPMYINEIAQALGVPVSTASLNVHELEDAGLLLTEQRPGSHGSMKLCTRRLDSLSINLVPPGEERGMVSVSSLPIGAYSLAEGIEPTCGMASLSGAIGEEDNPRTFYIPERLDARILWFRHGYLTYHFALLRVQEMRVEWIEISFELCSEAPMYRDPWKSDIDLRVNGVPVGMFTSLADYGGRRGLLNPAWWPDVSTQYGLLRTCRVTRSGSFMGEARVSDATVADLKLRELPYIAVRFGVSRNAANAGGLNLFGQGFGDYPQDVLLRVGYITDER
ncbi:MAG: helix-turn-helix domain-containing protein [Oscillospiraceae bacterium]|jgi:predicted transcriptional regulator|nr:helix-turn-helix domain-containing protein [Oscillospiraceae bacterium]